MMENSNETRNITRPTIYPSAIDKWIVVMLLLAPVTSIAIGLYLFQQGKVDGAITLFLCAAATGSLTAAFTTPYRYIIHHDSVTVRCGLICYQIPIAEMVSVSKSATVLSGPALSMKRVVIKTSRRQHILSPKQRDLFIEDLQRSLTQSEQKSPEQEKER